MDLCNLYICIVVALLYISECNANKQIDPKPIKVTYSPERFRSFQTSVKVTLRFNGKHKHGNFTGQAIKLKVFNRKNLVMEINNTLNAKQLEIPCDAFATPGRYFVEYFIQGLTKTFILPTRKPIIVRGEKVNIEVKTLNHTAFGSVSAWLNSKHGRCKPFKGKLKLYWLKNSRERVLVTTKKVNKDKLENRSRVHFRCNVFDTAGTFYMVYISDYDNRTIARSKNISVSWGKYELTAQSKNIFPCSNSFVIKFTSPYCDRTEDKIEMRSKVYNNHIDSHAAYHGFRSVFFRCEIFKTYIRDYCFYYTTKSSLTQERKIQAKLCVSSKKTEPEFTGWTEWSPWGSCTSLAGCGHGKKYRVRYCPIDPKSKTSLECIGMESIPCTLPPCTECKSCGCVFNTPDGTIVSPKFRLPFTTRKELSSCHWFIEVAEGMKVRLWFDLLKLTKNSSVVIRNGNSSDSQILARITHENEGEIEDIYSTFNVISIWYSVASSGLLIKPNNDTGFQLSYAAIDDSHTSVPDLSTSSESDTRRLAKMTFIGILAVLVVITFTVVAVIIVKIRRQRSKDLENARKTVLTDRPSSSHTSTACMSESTTRSYYEPQLSADESVNNNSSLSRLNKNHRARLSTRVEHRTPVHICPRCSTQVEYYHCEHNDSCHTDGRRILYNDPYYRHNIEHTQSLGRAHRVHSTIERKLSGASFVSEDNFPQRNYYPTYL